ncbi:MAG TPA: hypothetical protein VEC35_01385 [Noviherbaspirillum sp.]|nr:hypothetical protein [Noviherbaspirillum sp.]
MSVTQTITAMPTPAPARTQSQSTFDAAWAAWIAAMPTHITEVNTWKDQVNALAAALNAIAAGTAFAIPYTFDSATTDEDPGAGKLRLNQSAQDTSTAIRVDLSGADLSTYTDLIDSFDDSTSAVKGQIRLVKMADPTKWIDFNLTAKGSESGYRNLTVVKVASSSGSPFTNGDSLLLLFTRTGDKGETGNPGTNGTNGKNAGLAYTYSNNTSATDPTAGKLKFDNTTLASATKLYISETDADTNGIAAELATWDDSTSTVKGTLKVAKSTDPTKFAIYRITGSVTDNGTWNTFNLTYVTGAGSITDGDAVTVNFYRTGDAGTSSVGNHAVVLSGSNGHGSTNNKIRRFTTTITSVGTAITYADSATLGATFTINETGFYSITYVDRTDGGTASIGVSLNSAQLTTGVTSINVSDRLVAQYCPADNTYSHVTATAYCTAGDVIRAHTDGTNLGVSAGSSFSIRKVGA